MAESRYLALRYRQHRRVGAVREPPAMAAMTTIAGIVAAIAPPL